MKIHFIGIGGTGMGGVAQLLRGAGHEVRGSDTGVYPPMSDQLAAAGIEVYEGYRPENLDWGPEMVVVGNICRADHVEVLAAQQRGIALQSFPSALEKLVLPGRQSLVVAGTHGKTTTTSLIASIFAKAGLDPTFIIGGLLNSAESNARLGASRYIIAEADESDASFLHLQPMVSVLTNVDRDHLGNYEGSFEKLQNAFIEFAHNLPFYGLVVACIDDPVVKALLPAIQRPILTYGFDKEADFQAYDLHQDGLISAFRVRRGQMAEDLAIQLNMPGRHNVLNALAAIVIASDEGVKDADIVAGLEGFDGVSRRFQVHGRFRQGDGAFLLVDDYGHHPSEVRATIEAVRKGWPDSRLVMVYQPHRFSRTLELFDQFVDVLAQVDCLILLDTYPAGEKPIPGASSSDLFRKLELKTDLDARFLETIEDVPEVLEELLSPGDFVITQGAGETVKLARTLTERWEYRRLD